MEGAKAKAFPGQTLRRIREARGLTLKEVEAHSRRIFEVRHNPEYLLSAGRLSQVENRATLPSLYKLATLSHVYRIPYTNLLLLYGINAEESPGEQLTSFAAGGGAEAGKQSGEVGT